MEYKPGLADGALQMKDRLRAEGFPAVYLPGLWLRHHEPEAFGSSALRGLIGGDGVWTRVMPG